MIEETKEIEEAKKAANIIKLIGKMFEILSEHYDLLNFYFDRQKEDIIRFEAINSTNPEYLNKLARKKILLKRTKAILTLLEGYIDADLDINPENINGEK